MPPRLVDVVPVPILQPQNSEEKKDYCGEFCAIISRCGHRALKTGELQACGRFVAAAFREEFHKEPDKTLKLVNGANRLVNSYPIAYEKWLDTKIAQFLSKM